MDDGRFDALVRVLGSGVPRRHMLAGLLASMPMARARQDAAAKGKGKGPKKKKKKKTNRRCPRAQNCAGKDCGDDGCGGVCGTCTLPEVCDLQDQCCTPACAGKECGPDGCGGVCDTCDEFPNSACTEEGQCECEADCAGKECGSDGCGGSCGTCQNGTCSNGDCLCPFPTIRTDPICDPGFCDSCGPGVCCTTGQTCVSGSCGACPATPDPCAQELFCGATSADNDEPFCYCMTSIDNDTTCTSVFGNKFQFRDCTSDADCATLINLGGAQLVCVNLPCLSPFMANPSVSKICLNKGCVDLSAQRAVARAEGNAPAIRQFNLRGKR